MALSPGNILAVQIKILRRPSIFVPLQEVDETQIAFERRQRTLRLQSLTPISPDRLRHIVALISFVAIWIESDLA